MQNRCCKIITISLIIFLLVSIMPVKSFAYGSVDYENFSEYKSKYRILYGIILVTLGGVLAYDGFRNMKIDISKPEVKIDAQARWSESTMNPGKDPNSGDRDLESKGTITNTGNVTLRQVTFEVRYRNKDLDGYYPEPGYAGPEGEPVRFNDISSILYVSEVGQTDTWGHDHKNWNITVAGSKDPLGDKGQWNPELVEILNIRYSYDKKYKEEMNNVYEGVAGVLLAGVGIYLLVDYVVGLKKFDYYMKKHDLNFYVQNNYEEFQFMLSKRI